MCWMGSSTVSDFLSCCDFVVLFTHTSHPLSMTLVGFARTNEIELAKDSYSNSVDPDLFKVISPKVHILDDGNLFPFLHSTDIYPEYPVAALTSVPKDVAEEVQEALLALQAHADAFKRVLVGEPFDPTRCDTTLELATLAEDAALSGHLLGFRTPRSYFDVRTMHEATGFMLKDERGDWHCTRAHTVYESIKCPKEHYKVSLKKAQLLRSFECGRRINEAHTLYLKNNSFPLTSSRSLALARDSSAKTGMNATVGLVSRLLKWTCSNGLPKWKTWRSTQNMPGALR